MKRLLTLLLALGVAGAVHAGDNPATKPINRDIAEAMGTNAPRISSMVFALGTGVAGMAGVLAGPILSVYPTMCFDLLMILFVVVILGGLAAFWGSW